jgi:ankyrin repeat protein
MHVAVYGNDYDSALHLAIKHGPTEVAMALIENGANVDFPNAKVSLLSSVKKFAAVFFVCQL